jgi:hypothetical protein
VPRTTRLAKTAKQRQQLTELRAPDAAARGEMARLDKLRSDATDQIGQVIKRMADRCLQPRAPGQPWAGREDLIAWAIKQFSKPEVVLEGSLVEQAVACSRELATDLVNAACIEVYSQESGGDDTEVQRQLQMSRLVVLRDKILDGMLEPRVERRFIMQERQNPDFPENPSKRVMVKVPDKEKEIKGLDYLAIRLLLIIEDRISSLLGLDRRHSDGHPGDTMDFFQRLEESDATQGTIRSITQIVKNKPISDMSGPALKKAMSAIDAARRRRQEEPRQQQAATRQVVSRALPAPPP